MSISRKFDDYLAAQGITVNADVEEPGPCEVFRSSGTEGERRSLEAVKRAIEEALRS